MADLTTLYRAVDSPFRELIPKSFEGNIGTGRWYTPDIDIAKSYATKPGSTIYSMDVAPSDITKSNKLKNRLISKGYDWMDNAATLSDDVVLASKELLNKGKPSINWGKTLGTNLELLGNQGLGFLKNNALRTLAMLGSLPAQIGIMSLAPTRMGNAEIPSHWRPPAHITGGNGGGNGWSPGVGASQRGSNAPGFTDPGKGSYGPWKADGGLATMFQRR